MEINKFIHSGSGKAGRLLVFLILLGILIPYVYNLTGWLIHDDEGNYLYQAWRMTEGEIPYKDFYVPEGPLFLFTGYLIFKVFGPLVIWARMFSAVATLLTGYLIFLIGRRIYGYGVGLAGLVSYLILPVVYFQARLYRSDAYAVFFSTLGLFLFIKAWQDKRKLFFVCSGIFYALSLGYKLFAVFGLAALVMFIIYQAVTERKFSVISQAFVPFISGFSAVAAVILIIIYRMSPSFLTCVVVYHFDQPGLYMPNLLSTIVSNIKEFFMVNNWQYSKPGAHSWLIIFSMPLMIKYLYVNNDLKRVFVFYTLNIFWLLFSPYSSETGRYLLYFMPVVVLVFTSFVFSLVMNKRALMRILGIAIVAFALAKIFIPGLIRNIAMSSIKEGGTRIFAEYIEGHTDKGDYVVADYGDTLFYARRRSTPLMSGISEAAVLRGGITVDDAIDELEKYHVKLVLIHKRGGIPEDLASIFGTPFEPHHIISLIKSKDGYKFMGYLNKHYVETGTFNRIGQIFEIYTRKD